MKLNLIIVGVCVILYIQGCSNPSTSDSNMSSLVDYTVYTRYNYGGPKAQFDTTFYFCTRSKTAFDSLFYFVSDHSDHPDTIPLVDFSTKKVISIVKYGNDFSVVSVKSVSLLDKVLNVEYSDSLIAENVTWTISIPIIITTGVDFRMIRFNENGKILRELIP